MANKRIKKVVKHAYLKEGADWPQHEVHPTAFPEDTVMEDVKAIHVAEREDGTDIDIWWLDEVFE
jgi:hypothetical protein